MKKTNNKQKGITLVALVITIVILLILAGISISALTNQGLFTQAQDAKKRTENAQIEEYEKLGDYGNKIEEYIEGTREQIMVDKAEYEQLKADIQQLKQDKEKYDQLIKDVSDLKNSSNSPYIDTSNVISVIASESDWSSNSYTYAATEDCVITGTIAVYGGGNVQIYINDKSLGYISNYAGNGLTEVICYYLKSGDTIKLNSTSSGDFSIISATAFGTK